MYQLAFVVLFLVFGQSQCGDDKFKLVDCDPKSSVTLNITKFPSPFRLLNNHSFYLSAGVKVHKRLPSEIKLEISVARKMLTWFRIPCLGCDMVLTCKDIPELCLYRDMCRNCSASITDLKITLPGNLEEMIPGFIPGFVLEGYYWLRVRAIDPSNLNRRVACIEVYLPLDDDKKV